MGFGTGNKMQHGRREDYERGRGRRKVGFLAKLRNLFYKVTASFDDVDDFTETEYFSKRYLSTPQYSPYGYGDMMHSPYGMPREKYRAMREEEIRRARGHKRTKQDLKEHQQSRQSVMMKHKAAEMTSKGAKAVAAGTSKLATKVADRAKDIAKAKCAQLVESNEDVKTLIETAKAVKEKPIIKKGLDKAANMVEKKKNQKEVFEFEEDTIEVTSSDIETIDLLEEDLVLTDGELFKAHITRPIMFNLKLKQVDKVVIANKELNTSHNIPTAKQGFCCAQTIFLKPGKARRGGEIVPVMGCFWDGSTGNYGTILVRLKSKEVVDKDFREIQCENLYVHGTEDNPIEIQFKIKAFPKPVSSSVYLRPSEDDDEELY